jgi:ABC-type amino acid transport substrate-binding protein
MICTAATITAGRRRSVGFSDPYLETTLALVARAGGAVRQPDDLGDGTVGVRVATVAEDFVRRRCTPGCRAHV